MTIAVAKYAILGRSGGNNHQQQSNTPSEKSQPIDDSYMIIFFITQCTLLNSQLNSQIPFDHRIGSDQPNKRPGAQQTDDIDYHPAFSFNLLLLFLHKIIIELSKPVTRKSDVGIIGEIVLG